MKKLTKKSADKLFKIIDDSWSNTHPVTYQFGEETIEIEIIDNVSAADLEAFAENLLEAGYINGTYQPINIDLVLSRLIIEYCTNLPLPLLKAADNDSSVDLNICYEIVFGENGLDEIDHSIRRTIDNIMSLFNGKHQIYKTENSSVNKLCTRLLNIIDEGHAVVNDMINNPKTQELLFNKINEALKDSDE